MVSSTASLESASPEAELLSCGTVCWERETGDECVAKLVAVDGCSLVVD